MLYIFSFPVHQEIVMSEEVHCYVRVLVDIKFAKNPCLKLSLEGMDNDRSKPKRGATSTSQSSASDENHICETKGKTCRFDLVQMSEFRNTGEKGNTGKEVNEFSWAGPRLRKPGANNRCYQHKAFSATWDARSRYPISQPSSSLSLLSPPPATARPRSEPVAVPAAMPARMLFRRLRSACEQVCAGSVAREGATRERSGLGLQRRRIVAHSANFSSVPPANPGEKRGGGQGW